jgi:hypothetical protein
MTCLDCQHWLQQWLDGVRPSRGTALDEHLAECAACRGLFAAAQRLETGLGQLSLPTPPAGLSERIVLRVLAQRRSRRRRQLTTLCAVAASLLLVVLAASLWVQHQSKVVVVVAPPPPQPEILPRPPASLEENVAEATTAMAALTRRTADATVAQGRLLLPVISMPSADQDVLSQALEPPVQSVRQAGQGVTTSLEPVTTSARRAVAMFLRDLPLAAPEGKNQM